MPVILTADHGKAGYVASFSWATNQGSETQDVMTALATGIYMSGAYERVSMSITDRRSKDLVYSYTCQKGGRHMQSVAECLAKQGKEAFEKGKIHMREYSATELAGIQEVTPETVSVRKDTDVAPAQITSHPAAAEAPSMVVVSAGPETESLGNYSRRMKAEKDTKK